MDKVVTERNLAATNSRGELKGKKRRKNVDKTQ